MIKSIIRCLAISAVFTAFMWLALFIHDDFVVKESQIAPTLFMAFWIFFGAFADSGNNNEKAK